MSLHRMTINGQFEQLNLAPAKRPSANWSNSYARRFEVTKNAAKRTAEIEVQDIIGIDDGGRGVTAAMFQGALKDLGNIDEITVNINSPGGIITQGMAIYNMLTQHPAKIITHVTGAAWSAASWLVQAGDERRMADLSTMMVHNGQAVAMGDHHAMRKQADILEKLTVQMAEVYAKRSGRRVDTFVRMMNAETWLTPTEAKTEGMIDKIGSPASATANRINARLKEIEADEARLMRNSPAYRQAAVNARARQVMAECGKGY